ncbi:MAG TPA: phosphopentomutase [Gemmatimonadaceae bacterium]|nr:phosphopentomutase [Gemmatimonadaceae bacterium]
MAMTRSRRAAIIVLDGVGAGEAPDAAMYGDVGSDTLANTARAVGGFELPALEALGLGRIKPIEGLRASTAPRGAWGVLVPKSAGKDSTTGHWEIAGLHLAKPFPTYANGFPASVIDEFARLTGRAVIGNVVASGTAVIEEFGSEHMRRGAWIVYTSADSVFQIAAHEGVVPLDELYAACDVARAMLVEPHNVSRVIARPFDGEPGRFVRVSSHRRDVSIEPPGETLLDALASADIDRAGIGKVDDLFAKRSITATHTANNAAGIAAIDEWLRSSASGFLFVNLVDFDQLFGHRNDAAGFYGALREFDRALPSILSTLREDDLLFITADHGNDPTTPSTDHARECVPLLAAGPRVRPVAIGHRSTFSDLGATVAEWFELGFRGQGQSFLADLVVR